MSCEENIESFNFCGEMSSKEQQQQSLSQKLYRNIREKQKSSKSRESASKRKAAKSKSGRNNDNEKDLER